MAKLIQKGNINNAGFSGGTVRQPSAPPRINQPNVNTPQSNSILDNPFITNMLNTATSGAYGLVASSPEQRKQVKDKVVNNLPLIGGIGLPLAVGATAPASIPALALLAFLGAAGGTGYKQSINELTGNTQFTPEQTTGERVNQVAKEQLVEGGTSAASEITGGIINKALQPVGKALFRKVPETFWNTALDLSKSETKAGLKTGSELLEEGATGVTKDKSLSQKSLSKGISGTITSLKKKAVSVKQVSGRQLESVLKGSDVMVDTTPISDLAEAADLRGLVKLAQDKAGVSGDTATKETLEAIVTKVEKGEALTAWEAQTLKSTIDKTASVTSSFGTPVEGISLERNYRRRLITDYLRGNIKDQVPEAGTLLDELSYWNRLEDALLNKEASGGRIPKGNFGLTGLIMQSLLSPLRTPGVMTPAAAGLYATGTVLDAVSDPALKAALKKLMTPDSGGYEGEAPTLNDRDNRLNTYER